MRAVCHSHTVPRNHRRHGRAPHAHRLAIWLPHRASYASRLMPPRHPPARGSVLQTHLRRRSWPFSRRRPALPRLSLPLSACPLSLTSWLPSSRNSEGRCKKITPQDAPKARTRRLQGGSSTCSLCLCPLLFADDSESLDRCRLGAHPPSPRLQTYLCCLPRPARP